MIKNIVFGSNNVIQKTTDKPLICPEKPLQLKKLCSDQVSFSGKESVKNDINVKYIEEAQIHEKVREFSDEILKQSGMYGRLKPEQLVAIIKKIMPEGASVEVQQASCEQMQAAALCAARYDNDQLKTAIFADFRLPVPDLIENLTHEFTHVLQQHTRKQDELHKGSLKMGLASHQNLEKATDSIEDKILYIINEQLPKYEDAINNKLMSGKVSAENVVDEYNFVNNSGFEENLKQVMKEYSLMPDKFTLEYIKNRAEKEAQAYREGNMSLKEVHNMPDIMLTIDLIPVLYDRWAKFMQEKLKETNKTENLLLYA